MKKYGVVILAVLALYGCKIAVDEAAERKAAADAQLEAAIQRRNVRMMMKQQDNQQPVAEQVIREEGEVNTFLPKIPPVPSITSIK